MLDDFWLVCLLLCAGIESAGKARGIRASASSYPVVARAGIIATSVPKFEACVGQCSEFIYTVGTVLAME